MGFSSLSTSLPVELGRKISKGKYVFKVNDCAAVALLLLLCADAVCIEFFF